MKRVVEDSKGTTNDNGPTMWSIKVDEIATEKRLRYKTETNEILGLCAKHSTKENIIFSSVHVAEQLEHRLNEDTLHFAIESCVFFYVINGC